MSYELLKAVLELEHLPPAEHLTLAYLAWRCNAKTGRCDPGVGRFAPKIGLSPRQIFRVLDALTEKGLLIRHRGGGRGVRTYYGFPPSLIRQKQGTLWGENTDTHVSVRGKKTLTSQAVKTLTPTSSNTDTHVSPIVKEKITNKDLPYGRLNAAAAYRQALVDLPQNGNHQAQVAVLVDFTRAHCPTATVPGRLAALVRDYAAEDVLAVLWQAIPKDRPLDYAQATLRNKASGQRGPPPQPDFSEYERVSRQGKGHEEEK